MTFPKRDLSDSSGGNAETIGSHDFSVRRIREEFAECRDNRRSLETLRNRKIRYPLSVVEIRGHVVNFLGGMTTQEKNKEERRMENAVWCMGL